MQLSGFVRRGFAAMVVGLAFGGATHAQQLQFELIAGGAVGDNGPALGANLAGAGDAIYDSAGNLYIAQASANRIRKIAPNGTVTTLVGGSTGFSGDNGLASQAQIDQPTGLGLDAAGNLYFNDSGNRRVRRITPAGFITTIAGNGSRTHSGDGGSALAAGFGNLVGMAVTADGTVYVSDNTSHRVRRIAGGLITTVAGTGTSGYSGDGGAATSAMLNAPAGLDIDGGGNLYIADSGNGSVRRVAPNGTIATLLHGSAAYVYNVKVDAAGAVYTADNTTCYVVRYFNGSTPVVAGTRTCGFSGDGGAATQARIGFVDGLAIDPQGNLVIVDTDGARARRVVTATGIIQTIAGTGGHANDGVAAIGAPMSWTHGVDVEADGDVLVTDARPYKRVRRITPAGAFHTVAGNGERTATGNCPTTTPCVATHFAFSVPYGVVGHEGGVLVSDRDLNRVYRVGVDGNISAFAGGGTVQGDNGPATSAIIDPYGMAKNAAGDLFIADLAANRIRRVNAGTITTVVGNGTIGSSGDGGPATSAQINQPGAVAFDAAGNLYLSELGGMRVRKVAPGGMITTFAGNGSATPSGDGGLGPSAGVGRVLGIAAHGSDVYLAAEGRLRRVDAAGIIRTVPGWTHYATGLAVRNGQLYVATMDGRVYRANVAQLRALPHDYDGDGKSDLAWRNVQTGANTVWKAASNANQLDVVDVLNPAWKIVGQGDFDGDGKADLFWRNSENGGNTIWRSANHATQTAVVGVSNQAWRVVGVGDFNGDGKSDLAWRNGDSGQNVVWYSGNAATQQVLATVPSAAWRVVGVGDFDADGKSDLLWRNGSTGANAIWRSANSLTQLPIAGVNNPAWTIQGVGDFDGDGKADVFWRNVENGGNTIWRSGDVAQQVPTMGVTSQQWRVVAVGDYDGDGKSDLAWRNAGTGANTIWRSGSSATQLAVSQVANLAWTIVPVANAQ